MTSLADIGNNIIHADLTPAAKAVGHIAGMGIKVFIGVAVLGLIMWVVSEIYHWFRTLTVKKLLGALKGLALYTALLSIIPAAIYVGVTHGSGYAAGLAGLAGLVMFVIGYAQEAVKK
jgi:hypothetical protein